MARDGETSTGLRAPRSDQVTGSIDEPGAGTSYSVPALAQALVRTGVPTRLHVIEGWRVSPDAAAAPAGVEVIRHPQSWASTPVLGKLCRSSALEHALARPQGVGRVIHVHGLWSMLPVHAAAAARRTGDPLVVSPRGMLGAEALAFSRTSKRLFGQALQNRALRRCACFHATSEAEKLDIRAAGLSAPVAVIPNGVDVPDAGSTASIPTPGERVVLSIGRVHPKKGLDRLVRAWRLLETKHAGWRLKIVGPAELGYDDQLRRLAAELDLGHVSIEGAAYCVLPTLNENFAMTVAEALAHGLPVVSSKGAPWSGLVDEGCGWCVDGAPDTLAAALDVAMASEPQALATMGAKGRDWMLRDFSWARVAQDMTSVYRWLGCGGPPPACVTFD